MNPAPIIVWFRRDLRLRDNPALLAAAASGAPIVPVYIHAPEEETPWAAGAASRWWLHHSLAALDAALRGHGGALVLRRGPSLGALLRLARETGAFAIYWNRLHEPAARARDRQAADALRAQGLKLHTEAGGLLFDPDRLRNQAHRPYQVFTPFWKACQRAGLPLCPSAPAGLPRVCKQPGETLESLGLLPEKPWADGFARYWQPGEDGAWKRLHDFLDESAAGYAEQRDFPARPATSRLSAHLHFGEISPCRVVEAVRQRQAVDDRPGVYMALEGFLRQLVWREFAHHLLHHFPHTSERCLHARFEALPRDGDATALAAWQQGRTGIPLVDAGMRQLWHTGWMHNRVRMVAASFLVKNLLLPWQAGARWFWDTLVDADLANNTLGWQWTAGCGADAAPYVRVFNPVLQSRRFDPDGRYLRRWLPELAALSGRAIHAPWEASPAELRRAGLCLGRDYPLPLVDLAASRQRALAAWETFNNA